MSIINECRDAIPLFKVSSVSMDDQKLCATENLMVNITIRFYGEGNVLSEGNDSQPLMKEIQAVMPKLWTPKMYLGLLNISIEQNQSIIIETVYYA